MSFLKKVEARRRILAEDGPHGGLPSGASHPENWASKTQTGKSDHDMSKDAQKLHGLVTSWQNEALDAYHIFEQLTLQGGLNFERYAPTLLKGMSRKKLNCLLAILQKFAREAPTV